MQIAVVGGGVVGMSVASTLAVRGIDVALVEQNSLGSGTSGLTYAWVNANGKQPETYFELNRRALQLFRSRTEGRDRWFFPIGHLQYAVEPSQYEQLRTRVEWLEQHDYKVSWLSQHAARELAPDVSIPSDVPAIAHFQEEGYCQPLALIAHLRAQAVRAGARILTSSRVVGAESNSSAVELGLADGRHVIADAAVFCTGRWTQGVLRQLVEDIDVPMVDSSIPGGDATGFLAVTGRLPVELRVMVSSPDLHVRPDGGARLMLQATDLDGVADPDAVSSLDSPIAEEFTRRLVELVPATAGSAELTHLDVGRRALPLDGLPVLGWIDRAPRCYVVATHSGVTLSLLLGQYVADEVLGARVEEFDDFRPSRCFSRPDPNRAMITPDTRARHADGSAGMRAAEQE